ncbi:MAG: flagellar biosynthetic protein FliO [bacterium]|nr:flagellar biosynthetic protein FliO [bacterium]
MTALLGLQTSRLESVAQFFTAILIFILVLALTYFTTRFVGKFQQNKMYCKNIEVIETYKITANKYVQIVRTGEKYLAIAVCKDTVTLLTELSEENLDLTTPETTAGDSFQDVLARAKDLIHKGK